MRDPFRLRSVAACLLLASCGDTPKTPPASMVPVADRARAFAITSASDLIGGPKASGRVGDFLLANTKVRFIVEGAGRTRTWFAVGGALIDADRAGSTGNDLLQEMVTRLGSLGVLYAETVTIENDGSDGSAAVIKVTGHDMGVPYLQSVTPMQGVNVKAVTEYRLEPYAESLAIVTTVTDAAGSARTVQVGDAFAMGDFVTRFAPVLGSDSSKLQAAQNLRGRSYRDIVLGEINPGFQQRDQLQKLFLERREAA